MDAFRAFDVDGKGYISQLELTTGLLEMQIHYTQAEIETFVRFFDIENTKRIKFSDFGKAFLPNNRDYSLKILTRAAKNLKKDKKLSDLFDKKTLVQYMILWRIILRQMWEIESKKKQYCQANCYDAERIFFDIDSKRRGFIDLDSVRTTSTLLTFIHVVQRVCGAAPIAASSNANRPSLRP